MKDITLFLLIDGLLAAGLTLAVGLFLVLKREITEAQQRWRRGDETLSWSLDQLKKEVDSLGSKTADLEQHLGELSQVATPVASMDAARRSQALRMHHRGERPEQIAAALGMPQGEVDLLLKLHRLTDAA